MSRCNFKLNHTILFTSGLVNYVSDPGAGAFDRALILADTIAKNGWLFDLTLS
jgi:hypothetical protein